MFLYEYLKKLKEKEARIVVKTIANKTFGSGMNAGKIVDVGNDFLILESPHESCGGKTVVIPFSAIDNLNEILN